MSNTVKGEFELPLGGVTYRFKVGVGALLLAQEQIGKETGTVPRFDELTAGLDGFRLLYVRAFLWAGLRKYHAEVTLDGVLELLDAADEGEAVTLLAGLRQSAQPDRRDLAALEDAGARPIGTATVPRPTPIRVRGGGRSTSRHARPA